MTQTNSTTADIFAILEARRIQAAKLAQSATTRVNAALAAAETVTRAPSPAAVTLAAPATPTPATPSPTTPDEVIAAFLERELPGLVGATQALVTPPFSLAEVWRAVEEVREGVSFLVATGLPTVKGLDALALVQVLVRYLLRRVVQPHVPGLLYPVLERTVVSGVEWVYLTKVKPRLSK